MCSAASADAPDSGGVSAPPEPGVDDISEHAIKHPWRARPLPDGERGRGARLPAPLLLALVGIAYFGVAKLGLSFSQGHDIVSAVWPPSGLALAAAIVFGPRVGPAIFLAALASNATGGSSLATAAGIATGNGLAAVTGALLLARVGFDPALRRVRDVIALAILGAAVSTALNATIGTSSLLAAGVAHPSNLWAFWRVWWLGDLTGVLLVAPPLLLLLVAGLPRARHRARIAEASLLAAALAAAMLIVLHEGVTLAFPIFPLIVLAAMRFRQGGAVLAALVVSTIAVIYTANGKGPFTGGAADMDLLRAQVFVGLAALTGLLVAAMRTEWERAEDALARLAESEHALAEAQRLAHIGSWEWEVAEDRIAWSDELHRIFGVERGSFDTTYESSLTFIHPDDRELVSQEVERALRDPGPFRLEHRVLRPDGEVRTIEGRGRVIVDDDGRASKLLGTAQDVTEQRLAEQRLEHQALHDPLTDLPNRALFLDRLQHALTRSRRPGSSLAVYFCDVDDFKDVNDSLGHEIGDELLVALPPRLREGLRAGDTVARFGGDEFVILCEDLDSEAEAIRIAERIAEAFRLPFELDGRPHHLSVSVGVVFVKGGQASAPEVLRDADAAMYRAKGGGKGRFELFDAQMRASLVARLQTEADLRRALDDGELRLLYQPVLSLRSDAFVGAEALVRWQHPQRGLLPPAEFIAVAEDSGLIAPLGAWVLGEACRQAAAWGAGRMVSINLSPRQLSHSDVPLLLERALEETGVDPAQLELEITENVLMEQSAGALAMLRRLKAMGVRLVLDDFGTGWSSLGYLKRFPIDGLKIDREFVDGLGSEPEDTAIVSAVLSMAQALELEVIAEGVETDAQLAWLRERGCGYAQGFLLGRPQPSARLEADPRWRA
ncbi:MAG TPA: EAL domain-containing protein [Conexibacter sp.]|jgi:diguanylate cyclase (GGDEF)-like protein/PAS domain S-box-containing protein|nr:EAL domain-containing protein [Conexibacter sp.]